MKFRSTRKRAAPVSVTQAIDLGLASDGGLFVPETWPERKPICIQDFSLPEKGSSSDSSSIATMAAKVLAPFFDGDPLAGHLEAICQRAFNFPIPLRDLESQCSLLELFHGPTHAFKDFGARFLALCMDAIAAEGFFKKDPRQKMVLVATSGDTGGAVAAAFSELTKIPVIILYPATGISARQEAQLITWGPQVKAFAVRGSFDDCQRMVKEALQNQEVKNKFNLLSANSINLGRLLPQMAYFAYASSLYQRNHQARIPGVIVPSGNSGNGTAALWAQYLGYPIAKVVFAHNANRCIPDFFITGQVREQATIATLANAMDVGMPSNFERVLDLYPNFADLKEKAAAVSVSDEEIKKTIKEAYEKWGQVLCPHTATAVYAWRQWADTDSILVATAHPAKFESVVEPLLKLQMKIPTNLAKHIDVFQAGGALKTAIEPRLSELLNFF